MTARPLPGHPSTTPLDAARAYRQRGWAPVPVPYRDATPRLPGWQTLRLPEASLTRYFGDGLQNVGVVLGEPSGGLVAVTPGTAEAQSLARIFLPPTSCVVGRSSRRHARRLYIADPLLAGVRLQDVHPCWEQPAMLVELRSTGRHLLLPPSVQPDGEPVRFVAGGTPAVVDGRLLHVQVTKLALAALLARRWPVADGGHIAACALSDELRRAGWPVTEIARFVRAVASVSGDPDTAAQARVIAGAGRESMGERGASSRQSTSLLFGSSAVQQLREGLAICRWLVSRPDSGISLSVPARRSAPVRRRAGHAAPATDGVP